MGLLTYITSFDDVRGLLGVDSEELTDTTLSLRVFSRSLEETLRELGESVDPVYDLLEDYRVVVAVAVLSRNASQKSFFEKVQSFSAYCVADDAGSAIPLGIPKMISDSKATMQRHADSPYKLTLERISAGKARSLGRLKKAYRAFKSLAQVDATIFDGFVAAGSAVDPVTNT